MTINVNKNFFLTLPYRGGATLKTDTGGYNEKYNLLYAYNGSISWL